MNTRMPFVPAPGTPVNTAFAGNPASGETHPRPYHRTLLLTLRSVGAALCIPGAQAWAADYYWDGGPKGDGTNFTKSNWVGDNDPASSSLTNLFFTDTNGLGYIGGASSTLNSLDIGRTMSLRSMTFDNTLGVLPATLALDTNASGTTARTLTFFSGVTLSNTTTTVLFRGENGVLSYKLGADNTFTVSAGGTLAFGAGVAISGAYGITKAGPGTLSLSDANTYTGATNVTAGVLNIQSGSALGNITSGTIVSTGAALQLQAGITISAEDLTLNGSGVSNTGALRNISGANSFNGAITLKSATRINSDAGTLVLGSRSTLSGSTFALTIGGAGDITISSPINTASVTKDGDGTLTVSDINPYSGITTVNAGTLLVKGTLSGTSNVSLYAGTLLLGDSERLNDNAVLTLSGGTLNLAGRSETLGALTLSASSIIDFDSVTLTGGTDSVLLFSTAPNWTAGTTLSLLNVGAKGVDRILFGSSLTQAQLDQISFNGLGTGQSQVSFNGGTYYELRGVPPVPEPSTIATGAALLALLGWRERRRLKATLGSLSSFHSASQCKTSGGGPACSPLHTPVLTTPQ